MYRAMRFLHSSAKKSPSSLLPEARGTVDGITRGKKAKKQVLTQAGAGSRKKGEINLTLVNFTPLNYRC